MIYFMLYDLTRKKIILCSLANVPAVRLGKISVRLLRFSTNCWLCCLHIWYLKHMGHPLINSPEYHHFEHLSENLPKNWLQFSICQERDRDIWFSRSPSKWHINSLFFSVLSFYPGPESAHQKNNRSGLCYSSFSQKCLCLLVILSFFFFFFW